MPRRQASRDAMLAYLKNNKSRPLNTTRPGILSAVFHHWSPSMRGILGKDRDAGCDLFQWCSPRFVKPAWTAPRRHMVAASICAEPTTPLSLMVAMTRLTRIGQDHGCGTGDLISGPTDITATELSRAAPSRLRRHRSSSSSSWHQTRVLLHRRRPPALQSAHAA